MRGKGQRLKAGRGRAENRIAELERILRDAGQELRELTGGQPGSPESAGAAAYPPPGPREDLQLGEPARQPTAEAQIAILDALPAHISLIDSTGTIRLVNDPWKRFAAANAWQRPDLLVGENYLTVCDEATGAGAEEARIAAAGIREVLGFKRRQFTLEYPSPTPDQERWFRLMVTRVSEAPEAGCVVMHVDVTDRKLAEIKTQRLNRLYAVSSAINEAIVRTSEVPRLYQEACRIAVEAGEFRMAWVGLVGPGGKRIEPTVWWGADDGYLDELRVSPHAGTPTSTGPGARAFRTGAGVRCNDIATDPAFPLSAAALARGYRSCAAFPLSLGGRSIGIFVVYAHQPGFFNEEEMNLLGRLAADLSFAMDIHEREVQRRKAEQELRASEERFRQVVENIREVFWITDPAHHRILYASPAYEVLWGRTCESLYQSPGSWLEAIHPEDRERVRRAAGARNGTGTYDETYRVVQPNGSVRWIRDQKYPVRGPGGEVYRVVGTAEDITERKLAEVALMESEAEFRASFENAGIGMALVGMDGRPLKANRPLQQLLGYSEEELRGMPFTQFTHPDDLEPDRTLYNELMAGKLGNYQVEKRYLRKDGGIVLGRLTVSMIRGPEGQPRYAIGMVEDITERKKAELRLARVNRLYIVLSRVNEVIVRTDGQRELLDAVCQIAVEQGKFRMAAFVGPGGPGGGVVQPVTHFGAEGGFFSEMEVSLSDPRLNLGTVGRALRSGSHDVCNDTLSDPRMAAWRAPMSRHQYRSTAAFPVKVEGRVLGVLAYFAGEPDFFQEDEVKLLTRVQDDVSFALETLRKEDQRLAAGAALRASESNMAAAQRIAHFGSWEAGEADPDHLETGRWSWSAEICRMFKINPSNSAGRPDEFLAAIHPEDRVAVRAALRLALSGRAKLEIEHRILHSDGAVRWVCQTGELGPGRDGRPGKLTGTVIETTGRRLMEDALRVAEAKYRSIFDRATEGIFQSTPSGRYLTVNPAFARIYGYDSPADMVRLCTDIAPDVYVDPADREEIQRRLAAHGEVVEFEHQARRRDKTIIWVSLNVRVIRGADEGSVHYEGSVIDITERRTAREQLRSLSQAVEQSPVSIVITNPAGEIEYVNPKFTKVSGYEAGEVIGKNPRVLKAGDVPSENYRELWETITAGGEWRGEFHNRKKNGEDYWEAASISPVLNAEGELGHFVAVKEDITERRKTEAEVRRAAETLAGVVRAQREIADASQHGEEAARLAAEWARALTGAEGGMVEEVDGTTMVCRAGAGAAAGHVGLRFAVEKSLSGMTVTGGSVLWCEDTEQDPRVNLEICRRLGVRSMVIAPVRTAELIAGVLKVFSGRPGGFSQRDVHNVEMLGQALGGAILRHRAAEALRAGAEEFRALAETMPQIVWVTRADGWTTYFNRNWMRYTGLSLDESLGTGWNKPFHPDDHHRAWEAWQLATTTRAIYSLEARLRRADGEYRWWLIRGEPQVAPGGEVLNWFGTCTDIHDLKVAHLELSRANRALKLLSSCNEALIHADKEDALLAKVCQIGVENGGYSMVWAGYPQHDAESSILPVAFGGEERGYFSEITLSWDERHPAGNGPEGRAIRTGQPVVCADTARDPGFAPWQAAAAARGYRGVVCLPLRHSGKAFGLLGLCTVDVIEPDPVETRLLQELADDLAFGIMTLRARVEREKLHEAVLAIARGVSVGVGAEVFERLTQHSVAALGAHAGFIAVAGPPGRQTAHTLSAIVGGRVVENFEYPLPGNPCADVLRGETCVVDRDARRRFPDGGLLAGFGAEAYAGTPLVDAHGAVVGLSVVLFQRPVEQAAFVRSTLQIFASRAAGELERQRADAQVREQAALLDAAHEAILVKDLEDGIIYWNKGAERLYGWTAREAVGQSSRVLLYKDTAAFREAQHALLSRGAWDGEMVNGTKDGRELTVRVNWTLVLDAAGRPKSVLAINTDVTERKKLETQFLRSQRAESIGTLAGGIAHDLNNVLSPILMSVELLQGMATDETHRAILATVRSSAQRGADLVRQVLSFARGMEGRRVVVNLIHLTRDLVRVMQETFPKNIVIDFKSGGKLWTVTGDPTQLHQVVMNLCLNGRDAMPNGGRLTIRLENVSLDETYAGMNAEARPGPYVAVVIQDTGTGIPPEIQERVFEPFFTTKEVGKGTGLGLSTSLGIVKSHGGFIQVSSALGKGARFEVHLPADPASEAADGESPEVARLPSGSGETILVVDDEEAIRTIAQHTLRRFGYQVLTASHGAEAVALYVRHQKEVAVVLTDMAMPIMDGPALIIALRSINPAVRVIGSSGRFSEGGEAKATGAGVRFFLPKPYTAEAIMRLLRAVLDEPAS